MKNSSKPDIPDKPERRQAASPGYSGNRGAKKEAMKRATTIHRKDAFRLLEDRRAHNLRLWKLSTGDILEYEGAVCVGSHRRGGTHRVRLPRSGVLREFRDISLFEIDGLRIYW